MWPVNTVGTDGSIKGHLSLDKKLHLSRKFLTETGVLINIVIYDLRKTEYKQIEKNYLHESKLGKNREDFLKRILLKQCDSCQPDKCEGSTLNDSSALQVWKCNAATKALSPCCTSMNFCVQKQSKHWDAKATGQKILNS